MEIKATEIMVGDEVTHRNGKAIGRRYGGLAVFNAYGVNGTQTVRVGIARPGLAFPGTAGKWLNMKSNDTVTVKRWTNNN